MTYVNPVTGMLSFRTLLEIRNDPSSRRNEALTLIESILVNEQEE